MKNQPSQLSRIHNILAIIDLQTDAEKVILFSAQLAQKLGKKLIIFQTVGVPHLMDGQMVVGHAPFIAHYDGNMENAAQKAREKLEKRSQKIEKEFGISCSVRVEVGFETEKVNELLQEHRDFFPVISSADHRNILDRLMGSNSQDILGGPSPAAYILPDTNYAILPKHMLFLSETEKPLSVREMTFLNEIVKQTDSSLKIAMLDNKENPVEVIEQLEEIYRLDGIALHADEQGFWGRLIHPDPAYQLLEGLKYPMLVLHGSDV